uniref:Protein kinase putative n=1 Tax=Albugo laibachii Nc14 TaxID=890382 RepID=F0W3J6_9STRA|nr:protein kinase putative [Albugo laibachii Nc14]CCA16299.1 protein kinase putative [Albugo laibachii Nc14]|eukprot:CCA16299.1 protein kinase putative [Albugo laibachii Nc14]
MQTMSASSHTFVRSVKAKDVCFDLVDPILKEIKGQSSPKTEVDGYPDPSKLNHPCYPEHQTHQVRRRWFIAEFTAPHESRNTLKVVGMGWNSLHMEINQWPKSLFAPNTLCYGFYRLDVPQEGILDACYRLNVVKLTFLAMHMLSSAKKKHFGASVHLTLQHSDDLKDTMLMKQIPRSRHRRAGSRRFISKEIDVDSRVKEAIADVRSDSTQYNWVVCGYLADIEDKKTSQQLILIDKGMGCSSFIGLEGISSILKEDETMYVYLRVDIPLHRGNHRIVSKYVLITWLTDGGIDPTHSDEESHLPRLGICRSYSNFDDSAPSSPSTPESRTELQVPAPTTPSSKLQRVAAAHVHGGEIYRVFPHHVHFFASTRAEITEEAIRERVRRAVDNDCMLFRVVCVQAVGDTQPSICVEVPFDATLGVLQKEIAQHVGIPEHTQRILWIKQTENFEVDAIRNSKAVFLEDPQALLRKDLGLNHGDKIHVDQRSNGINKGLAKLAQQINSGSLIVSLSAERRHEVQRGVEAREAELKKILSVTHALIRHRKNKRQTDTETSQRKYRSDSVGSVIATYQDRESLNQLEEGPRVAEECNSYTRRRSSTTEDIQFVSDLKAQARKLECQNEYLDIPYDSIRILEGKENELGLGKAATVYRGVWMNSNGAAEVAIKLFRYVRLTDKILGDYTQEVALLRKLKHPNIVLFIGACTHPKLMILTEYCSRKSLYEVIHNSNFESIPWKYKVRMMLDAARGIQYLHSRRIIHRDIKSHNFLVDDDWRVKVADFGISKVLENDGNAFTQCGTTGWIAPEVLLDEELGYTFKADNWSFAIVMWEMVAGLDNSNPFIGMAPIKFYNQTVNSGIRPFIPEAVDSDYTQLVCDCWRSIPADRPSITLIVTELEKMVIKMGVSTDLPPAFQEGYHAPRAEIEAQEQF